MKPWDKQSIQEKQEQAIPDIRYIIETASNINNERLRCLFVLLYLSGGRICELVRKKGFDLIPIVKDKINKIYKYKKIMNISKDGLSIKKKQISFDSRNGRNFVLISIRNEKNKKKHSKEIPIPLDRQENKNLISMIERYLFSLEMEQELFPFGYQYAYKILKPYFNPHWFRHIRATHLTVKYDLPVHLLRRYLGWTDDRPAVEYQELKWGDILDRL